MVSLILKHALPPAGKQTTVSPPPPLQQAREEFDVDYFLVWHAIAGYWAGLDLDSPDLAKYKPRRAILNAPPGVVPASSICCHTGFVFD